MRDGPGDGAFDVVEKLFDDRVVCWDDESLELDPIAGAAFEVECVPKQHSSMAGYRFEDMPAVNDVPVHAVEGELSEPSGKICSACVSDPPMPPLAPSASKRSKIIGLQSVPGQIRSCGDPRVANNGLTASNVAPGSNRS